jgi:hypothetical protein
LRDFEAFKAGGTFARDRVVGADTQVCAEPEVNRSWRWQKARGELRAQPIYSLEPGLLPEPQYGALHGAAESATRLLGGLMRYLSPQSAKRTTVNHQL